MKIKNLLLHDDDDECSDSTENVMRKWFGGRKMSIFQIHFRLFFCMEKVVVTLPFCHSIFLIKFLIKILHRKKSHRSDSQTVFV